MHVNLLKLYPYACKLTGSISISLHTYGVFKFTVTYTSKECIFHVESKFRQKKYGLFQKNLEKDDFSRFLIKNYATPVGFDGKFFTTGGKNFKNNFFRTC